MTSFRRRWIPIWFLFAGGLINYMDRSAVSVVTPLMMKDLHLNPAQLGLIFSAFFVGYALFTFIGGYASDVLGPKRVFTLSMSIWSTFCGLTAAAVGFASLLGIRVVFGAGEGPFAASANTMVRRWFPRRQVASAIGVANAGTPIGGALAGPVAGWLALNYGWRLSFVVLACLGFVWTIFWSLFVADRPEDDNKLHKLEREEIEHDQSLASTGENALKLSSYIRQPTVLATAVSFFGYAYVLYFFLTWFPGYLTLSRGVSIQEMGFLNTIPWVCGAVGLTVSGFLCDGISRWTGGVLRGRKLVVVVCLSLAALSVAAAGIVSSLSGVVMSMSAAIFFIYLTGAAYWAILQEVVDRRHIGAVSGFVHLIANCAGIAGPAITGFIVQTSGMFKSAFVLAGAFALLGASLVAVFVTEPRQPSAANLP